MKGFTAKKIISIFLSIALLFQLTGCAYMFHPERKGGKAEAITGKNIDLKMFLLDTALLLLFIVPGVVAYAVDFSTGCIYLSPGEVSGMEDFDNIKNWRAIKVEREKLNRETIEKVIQEHTGEKIRLDSSDMFVFRPGHPGETNAR